MSMESLTLPRGDTRDDPVRGARVFRMTVQNVFSATSGAGTVAVFAAPCIVVGMLLRAGAAASTMICYNQECSGLYAQGSIIADATKEVAGVKTSVFDGFVNFPINCPEGLVASLDQTDAIGYIYYVPLIGRF